MSYSTPLNSWEFQCIQDIDSGSKVCTTEMHLMEDSDEYVLYFAHTHRGTAPFVVLGGDVPLVLTEVKVDDNDPVTADSCEAGSCFFDKKKSRSLLKQFKKGRRARVIIKAPNNVLLDREITPLGFSAAYGHFR